MKIRALLGQPALVVALVASTGCGGGDARAAACSSEVEAMQCASQLAISEPLPDESGSSADIPVVLYLDRSGSIRGFLDPSYPTRVPTDYRSVIDRLVVALQPRQAFGFGSTLRPASISLGDLGDRNFYTDSDTRMEQVLARIAADTALSSAHVIVGDGRRGSPDAANAQFTEMRSIAQQWVERGGAFVVGASLAPFQPIKDDPAGCRTTAASEGERDTCPLYAFAFVPPGDATRIASALSPVFEHLYVWPVPAVGPADLTILPSEQRTDIVLDRSWSTAPDGTPIARVYGAQAVNQPLTAQVVLRDTLSARSRLAAAVLAGQELALSLAVRPLSSHEQEWSPTATRGSLVRPVGGEPLQLEFLTYGENSPRYLYRAEFRPMGEPSWLDQFDAENATDEIRTFGLGRLFVAFRQSASQKPPPPIGRMYFVVN